MNVFLAVALKLFVAVFFFTLARLLSVWLMKYVPEGKLRRLLLRPVGDSARRGQPGRSGG